MGFFITAGYRFLNGEYPTATKLNRLGSGSFGVDTIADLTAIDVSDLSTNQAVYVFGYSEVGDGGEGVFYYDSASSATANGGTIFAPDVGSGRWIREVSGALNVKWFGAKGDNTTDDTSAIQDAIDYAETLSRATLYFPSGQYKVTSTLTVNSSGVNIVGSGMFNTFLMRSSDYGDTIVFTGNDATGALLMDVGLSDIALKSTAKTTSGAQLSINGILRGTFENIFIYQGFWAISCAGATGTSLRNINVLMDNLFTGSVSNRIGILLTAASSNYAHPESGDLFISDFNFRGSAYEYGIYLTAADGIWFSNGHVHGATSANLTVVNDNHQLGIVFFNNVMFDGASASYNVLFQGSSSRGRFLDFCNCEIQGNSLTTEGLVFAAACTFSDVSFSNVRIFGHTSHGVDHLSTACYRVDFTGCFVENNNTDNSANTYGYKIGAGVGSINITGGAAGGTDGTACNQVYGILLATGTGNNININSVDTRYNGTAGILNNSTGANVHIANCFDGSTNTVASGSTITLPLSGEVVNVSGTTNIDTITARSLGTRTTLIFAGILTVGDASNLKLAGAFITTADATLSLVCDGTNWFETGRSTN